VTLPDIEKTVIEGVIVMRSSYPARRHLWLLLAVPLLLVVLSPKLEGWAQSRSIQDIQARVQAAGSYRFTADVEQTLIPRPLPEMIGQTSQRADVRIEGELAVPQRSHLRVIFEGGGMDVQPMSLVQSGGQTFAQIDGELQSIDSPYALAAPSNDSLQYLDGAEDLKAADGDNHYTFAVDGQRLTETARDQMQAALEGSGELPPGVQLATAPKRQRIPQPT
jgi:hypothetical protein